MERLAALAPKKYSRAVLVSEPIVPAIEHMRGLTHAAFFVGAYEGTPMMRAAYEDARGLGAKVYFGMLPEATRGNFGSAPKTVLRAALDAALEGAPAPRNDR